MGSPAYDRGHTRRFGLKLNTKTDADIIAKLESVTSVQGYIKSLIRADLGEQTPGDNPDEDYNSLLQTVREIGGVQ
jgi:hypothetical protein